MEKSNIKRILRENIFSRIKEAEPKQAPAGESKPSGNSEKKAPTGGKRDEKQFNKDYEEVQRKLDGTLLKQNQIMSAAGLGQPDDATARSLFSRKLKKDSNDQGGVYQFDEKELAKIISVINNATAYLNVKK